MTLTSDRRWRRPATLLVCLIASVTTTSNAEATPLNLWVPVQTPLVDGEWAQATQWTANTPEFCRPTHSPPACQVPVNPGNTNLQASGGIRAGLQTPESSYFTSHQRTYGVTHMQFDTAGENYIQMGWYVSATQTRPTPYDYLEITDQSGSLYGYREISTHSWNTRGIFTIQREGHEDPIECCCYYLYINGVRQSFRNTLTSTTQSYVCIYYGLGAAAVADVATATPVLDHRGQYACTPPPKMPLSIFGGTAANGGAIALRSSVGQWVNWGSSIATGRYDHNFSSPKYTLSVTTAYTQFNAAGWDGSTTCVG